jgi:hypothetical protein
VLLAPVPGLSPVVDFIPATHDNILKAITDLFGIPARRRRPTTTASLAMAEAST